MATLLRFDERQTRVFRERFKRAGYVSIPGFLPSSLARDVHDELKTMSIRNWKLMRLKSPGFSYSYGRYPVLWRRGDATIKRGFPPLERQYRNLVRSAVVDCDRPPAASAILRLEDFFESKELRRFLRQVTRAQDLNYPMVNLTRFRKGDHISLHTDTVGIGFSLSLTRSWVDEWGGALEFFDWENRKLQRRYSPKFNRLIVFKTPVNHAVQKVNAKALFPRFVASGWFYQPE